MHKERPVTLLQLQLDITAIIRKKTLWLRTHEWRERLIQYSFSTTREFLSFWYTCSTEIRTSVEVHCKIAVSVAIDDGVDELLALRADGLNAKHRGVNRCVLWDSNLSLLGLKHRAGAVDHVDGNLHRGWQRRCAWKSDPKGLVCNLAQLFHHTRCKLAPQFYFTQPSKAYCQEPMLF